MQKTYISYQRPQVMYSLDIGSKHLNFSVHNRDVQAMAHAISKITGGCTLVGCIGMWADVERADKDTYDSYSIGSEPNVQLQVKAEIDKESVVEKRIIGAIIELAGKRPEFNINWVCGHKVQKDGTTVSFNFSVQENI